MPINIEENILKLNCFQCSVMLLFVFTTLLFIFLKVTWEAFISAHGFVLLCDIIRVLLYFLLSNIWCQNGETAPPPPTSTTTLLTASQTQRMYLML